MRFSYRWFGYSPEFQDAYNRRFKSRVEGKKIFNDWVDEYYNWLNQSNISNKLVKRMEITRNQVKSLAREAHKEGLQNISIKAHVRDKRTQTGYREVFRDIRTGHFAKNPYKEIE